MCENLRFCQNLVDNEILIIFRQKHVGRVFEEKQNSWVGTFFGADFSFWADDVFVLAEDMTDHFRRNIDAFDF